MEENKEADYDDQNIRAMRSNYNTSIIEEEDDCLISNDGMDPYSSNPMRKSSGKSFQQK